MKKGKLVVFEGISGTGKETQAKLLKDYLGKKGIVAHIVYHPTSELKEILATWRKNRHIDHLTEVYLLLADRRDRMSQVILPALKRGEWVISLRNFVSALVYQGHTSAQRAWIAHEFSHIEHEPDYLFWFDITPVAALARVMKRHQETGEPLGKFETPEHLADKRKKFQTVLRDFSFYKIDAACTIEQIHESITGVILPVAKVRSG